MASDEDLTANPGGMFAGQGDDQNGKSKDWKKGSGMGGTAAQDHADTRGKAGSGLVDTGGRCRAAPISPASNPDHKESTDEPSRHQHGQGRRTADREPGPPSPEGGSQPQAQEPAPRSGEGQGGVNEADSKNRQQG
jgi:hypothetical protein